MKKDSIFVDMRTVDQAQVIIVNLDEAESVHPAECSNSHLLKLLRFVFLRLSVYEGVMCLFDVEMSLWASATSHCYRTLQAIGTRS